MSFTQVDTIPNGCTMVERAEVYVGPDGTYYVSFTPSPSGVDGPKALFTSSMACKLQGLGGDGSLILPL